MILLDTLYPWITANFKPTSAGSAV